MTAAPARTQLLRDPSGAGLWELAVCQPAAAVRAHVRDYCGYTETTGGLLRRRELPSLQAVLIFDFGPPLRLLDPQNESRVTQHRGGFIAGVGDSFSLTEHDGLSRGIQVNLTPLGARLFLDVPMAELSNRIVAMDDLFSGSDRGFTARLAETAGWDARFELIDRFIATRVARSRAMTAVTAWALGRIEQSGGLADIGSLSRRTGYSHKHLITLFRDHIGLPPKLVARLVRFDRVIKRLKAGGGPWADIAADLGYYDQAHLVREVRYFSGCTPTAVREMLGAPGSIVRESTPE